MGSLTAAHVPWKKNKISRANKYNSKGIYGRTCDCTWMDHLTRRVGGCTAALLGRKKDGALRAPSFYILTLIGLHMYTSSTTGSEYCGCLHCGWLQVHVRSMRPLFCETRSRHDDRACPLHVHVMLLVSAIFVVSEHDTHLVPPQ